jgi:glutamine synthetase
MAAAAKVTSITAEYVWVGGRGEMRSKARTFHSTGTLASDLKFEKPSDLPVWNYDGSSTEQAPGTDSEVLLYPVGIYPDPFRKGPNIL